MENETYSHQGGWNPLNQSRNNTIFVICIIAVILHFLLWFQLFMHKTKFDLTILFSLGYISTDVFLLICYFIQYSIRIRSWIPVIRLSCYFEAYSMLYFNLLELYCLTALNVCRYWQITRNQNIYTVHRRRLVISCTAVPLLLLVNLIIQDIFAWSIVIEKPGSSCILTYTNIAVQVWNLTIVLITPILISFYMLFRALYYLQNTNAQQMIIRRNHHYRLMVHSCIFYPIWICLWLPLMIIIYVDIDALNESIQFIALLANTLEILVDPIIAISLDKRFAQAWKKSLQWIKHKIDHLPNIRVHPVV